MEKHRQQENFQRDMEASLENLGVELGQVFSRLALKLSSSGGV